MQADRLASAVFDSATDQNGSTSVELDSNMDKGTATTGDSGKSEARAGSAQKKKKKVVDPTKITKYAQALGFRVPPPEDYSDEYILQILEWHSEIAHLDPKLVDRHDKETPLAGFGKDTPAHMFTRPVDKASPLWMLETDETNKLYSIFGGNATSFEQFTGFTKEVIPLINAARERGDDNFRQTRIKPFILPLHPRDIKVSEKIHCVCSDAWCLTCLFRLHRVQEARTTRMRKLFGLCRTRIPDDHVITHQDMEDMNPAKRSNLLRSPLPILLVDTPSAQQKKQNEAQDTEWEFDPSALGPQTLAKFAYSPKTKRDVQTPNVDSKGSHRHIRFTPKEIGLAIVQQTGEPRAGGGALNGLSLVPDPVLIDARYPKSNWLTQGDTVEKILSETSPSITKLTKTSYPPSHGRWLLASSAGSFSNFHADADGFGTYIDSTTGCKMWIVAVPKSVWKVYQRQNGLEGEEITSSPTDRDHYDMVSSLADLSGLMAVESSRVFGKHLRTLTKEDEVLKHVASSCVLFGVPIVPGISM